MFSMKTRLFVIFLMFISLDHTTLGATRPRTDEEYKELQFQHSPAGQAALATSTERRRRHNRNQALRLGPISPDDAYYKGIQESSGNQNPPTSDPINDMQNHFGSGIILER